mmetsp:Transcript_961/g.2265  ORF Transcript_961/g.2265 Transcript_961/m.2265 type:complete len:755 (+) Transcript_961:305-2569(+)
MRLFEILLIVGVTTIGLGVMEYFSFLSIINHLNSAAGGITDVVVEWDIENPMQSFVRPLESASQDQYDDSNENLNREDTHDLLRGTDSGVKATQAQSNIASELGNINSVATFSSSDFLSKPFDKLQDFPFAFRGWHPEAREQSYIQNRGLVNDKDRLAQKTYDRPELEDPGVEYLPFDESLVLPEWQNEPRLVYDITVIRLRDAFGLINDEIQPLEWEDIFTRVIGVYARYNIYIRVSRAELANTHMLDKKRSLDYLAYLEGPDFAELMQIDSPRPFVRFSAMDREFAQWVRQQYQELYGLPLLDHAAKLPKGLKTLLMNTDKYNFQRNMLEWIVGYPMRLPPWHIVNSSPFFPLFYFHMRNGECRGGRLFGRTGSCWERRKPIIDPATGVILRNATCRRFEGGLKSRADHPVQIRAHESQRMRGDSAARMLSHELGHNFGEHHPADECKLFTDWPAGNLMYQLRFIGLQSRGSCSEKPDPNQNLATSLSKEQVVRIRNHIKEKDMRPSKPVPGSITIGQSTMQLGSAARHVTQPMRPNRLAYVSKVFEIVRKAPCSLHQSLVVLNLLPAPKSGRVARVRWMPAHPYVKPFPVEVYIVQPVSPVEDEQSTFAIVQRSGPLVISYTYQQSHRELDLPDNGLRIESGQMVAIARLDGHGLDIDQAQYASDAVLFSDVSGELPSLYDTIHDALSPQHLPDSTVYPKIADSPKRHDAFFYAQTIAEPGLSTFAARHGPLDYKALWCSQLLVNYDLRTN